MHVLAVDDEGGRVAGNWAWLCEVVVIPYAAFCVFRPCALVQV